MEAARREARFFGQFPLISAGIGPREQGFGPISGLAELRPPYLPPVSQSAADAGRWLRAGAHLLPVRGREPTGVAGVSRSRESSSAADKCHDSWEPWH